jgi:hypothetical protein
VFEGRNAADGIVKYLAETAVEAKNQVING